MADEKQISRREALKMLAAAAGTAAVPGSFSALAGTPARRPGVASASSVAGTGHGKRPNIVWIMLEGVPISVLSCYGSQLAETPNIDRIAREGMRFHNAFCTNALCAPSRSTFVTGKYSHLTGTIGNPAVVPTGRQPPARFDPAQQTIMRILKQHGYQTALAGKWHLAEKAELTPEENASKGFVNGYHAQLVSNPGKAGFDAFLFKHGAGGGYYDASGYIENTHPGSLTLKHVKHQGYATDVFTDYTIANIKRMAQAGQPFFMAYCPFNDHRPFTPPHRFENLYKGKRFPEPGTFWDDYSHRATAARMARMRIEYMPDFDPPADLTGRQRKRWNYQQFMHHFMGALHALDEDVGKVLDYLDDSGLADDTIVMLSSDHGFFMGDHGWFDKRFMYEQSIRVPWMIRWPGRVKPGAETDAWTINIDNAPTTLDLAGLSVPDDMQGRSLVPLFEGQVPKDWHRDLYYHYYEFGPPHWVYPHYGVRTERYKLINYYRQNEWELFDLDKDPDEMDSLFDWGGYKVREGYEDVVKDLVGRLKTLRETYRDDTGWPVKFWPTASYD